MPRPTDATAGLFRLLNQRKYPASPLFLLMTLGPTIALLPVAERARGWFADVLATFGRVPMFYYLLHIPLIHATALLVWLVARRQRPRGAGSRLPRSCRFLPASGGGCRCSTWSSSFVVAVLYIPCRWFAGVKARGQQGWLRYSRQCPAASVEV